MNQHEELDEELTRLFADERLAVPPRDGAETAILAGARRIRRRRRALATTGGALTAIVLVGGGLLVGDLRSNDSQVASPPPDQTLSIANSSAPPSSMAPAPPAASTTMPESGPETEPTTGATSHQQSSKTTPPKSSSRSTTVPAASGPVLGPNGYGQLQLGMSFDAAKATGLLAGAATTPTQCTDYKLTEGSAGVSTVTISPTYGIVAFQAAGAHTPEQIKAGSTKDQLETAYPALNGSGNVYSADAGSGGTYTFSMSGDKVARIDLVGPNSGC